MRILLLDVNIEYKHVHVHVAFFCFYRYFTVGKELLT